VKGERFKKSLFVESCNRSYATYILHKTTVQHAKKMSVRMIPMQSELYREHDSN